MPASHPIEFFAISQRNDAYRVSNLGRVQCCWSLGPNTRKTDRWRDLRPTRTCNGYLEVCLCRGGVQTKIFAHVLVAEVFLGPKFTGLDVRHLDGDKTNNVVTNLAYGTRTENMEDARGHGTLNEGERNGNAKLNREQVLEIRRLFAAGVSQADLTRRFNMSPMAICNIVREKLWKCLV